ncbi:hypothetical protein Nans01_32250 [Nocardiopsis ansamitocini]|uniref:Uncharacterized protein n=1 Tax=Nocardiopsis ansamitocini TaxID=1670832 RepID=A0A9W6UJI7_9ACTN|nr:hypothetical protein Nans01_32250 [Nocardiopsis ansamitocini]
MGGAHDLGPGDVEDLVAALVSLKVVQTEVVRLEHGAHRTVGDDDAGSEDIAKGGSRTHIPGFGVGLGFRGPCPLSRGS